MTTTTRTVLRLEIGYESRPGITTDSHEAIQKALRDAFFMRGWRDRWHRPFTVTYTSNPPGDAWVADAINGEIQNHLLDTVPRIAPVQDPSDRLALRPYQAAPLADAEPSSILKALLALPSGPDVTRCKISGAEWHDSRSYVLLTEDHTQLWTPSPDATDALFFFATLTWKCDIQTPVDPVDPAGTAN